LKLQPDRLDGVNQITRHGPDELHVGMVRFDRSVVVPWRGEVRSWAPASFQQLAPEHFAELVQLGPEVVLFGSGARLRFAPPAMLRALIERGVGVECMDTAAASRTYNVLAGEGRRVVAAMLVGSQG
jgi:uncharacterized protein